MTEITFFMRMCTCVFVFVCLCVYLTTEEANNTGHDLYMVVCDHFLADLYGSGHSTSYRNDEIEYKTNSAVVCLRAPAIERNKWSTSLQADLDNKHRFLGAA